MNQQALDRTLKNWRWWLVLPLLLPAFLWIAAGHVAWKPLWRLGQAVCGLASALSPYRASPAWVRAILDWVFEENPARPDDTAAG